MAESSAKRRRVDDGGGGEVPPLLNMYGGFSPAVCDALGNYDEDMLQRITDEYTVDAQDRFGATLLMYAADCGNITSVRFLIERGAAPNIQKPDKKETVLHWVCNPFNDLSDEQFEEMLVLLLRAGADPTLKDFQGDTPRDWAV